MSQSFAFPPPPPPPPKRDLQPNEGRNLHPQSNRGGNRGSGNFRGGHFSRGNNSRGRGRGYGTRPVINHGSRYGHPGSRGSDFNNRSSILRDNGSDSSAPQSNLSTKRTHAVAFENKPNPSVRPKAPPAVPSFNADIETLLARTKQSQAEAKPTVPKKSNLLGLTPSNNLSVSESEEDDGDDDEATLARMSGDDGLTFNHNGQTLSLRTPAEIAAWIAERKKRYPTNAKVEAAKKEAEVKKRAWEAQRKEREESARLRREEKVKQRHEHEKQKLKQRMLTQVTAKAKAAIAEKKLDGSQKAVSKAEKLRKEVERATEQLRAAEEALTKAQAASDHASPTPSERDDRNTDTASVAMLSDPAETSADELEDTSSSGSSDSDDASDADSAPEELSSKQPDSAQQLPHQNGSQPQEIAHVCRNYAKYGRCKYGKKCRFSHKTPKKEPASKGKASSAPGRRKGLYQIMVEKEQEEEQKITLRAIIALGERGLLQDEHGQSG